MQDYAVDLILLLALSGTQALARDRPIPPAAAAVVKRVHDAASAKNDAMLRCTMDDESDWSFGGDAGIDSAFDTWRHDPG
ncbi:hypothetical protein [Massilia sp. S19_KUP03_FR1]|uniref:hypothetical protein n=1 Tax=Massilia sp. S19_KUP03_FR1 TaxID=3025503 RepID=UPI002FCD7BC8